MKTVILAGSRRTARPGTRHCCGQWRLHTHGEIATVGFPGDA